MSDNPVTPEPDATPSTPDTPAEAQTTEPSGNDNRVPQARFSEVTRENSALKAQLEKLEQAEDQRKQAAMSELERAQKDKTDATEQVTVLETQLTQERQQRLDDRRDNAVAQALATAQAIDADETVDWLRKNAADDLSAAMSSEGVIDPDAIKTLVAKAKSERPHHFRPGGPGSPSNRGGEITQTHISEETRLAAEIMREHGYQTDDTRLDARIQKHRDDQATNEGRQ